MARTVLTKLILLGLLAALCVGGCGIYSFSGSSLPSHIKTIAVPIMENKTLDYEVANETTEAITQRFIQDNRLKVVGESRADCVLEGQITSYENKVYNYSADQKPQEYIVVIRVSATLRDAVKNREIWKEDGITVSAIYSVVLGSTQQLQVKSAARQQGDPGPCRGHPCPYDGAMVMPPVRRPRTLTACFTDRAGRPSRDSLPGRAGGPPARRDPAARMRIGGPG